MDEAGLSRAPLAVDADREVRGHREHVIGQLLRVRLSPQEILDGAVDWTVYLFASVAAHSRTKSTRAIAAPTTAPSGPAVSNPKIGARTQEATRAARPQWAFSCAPVVSAPRTRSRMKAAIASPIVRSSV